MEKAIETLGVTNLKDRLDRESPDNTDPKKGYALVNVLGEETFEKEHIPQSINIPKGREDEFEQRFSRDKEIIVYCASPECDASPTVARELVDRGFTNVRDFEGGMSEWKDADGTVEYGAAA